MTSPIPLEPQYVGRITEFSMGVDSVGKRFVYATLEPLQAGNPYKIAVPIDGDVSNAGFASALFNSAMSKSVIGIRKKSGTAEFAGEVTLFS